jgi:hyperosmotically inducible protein
MKTTNEYQQKILANRVLAIACLSAVFGLTGCEQEGPAEKAGEKVDRAAENAEQKIDQATEQAERKIEAAKESVTSKTQAVGKYVDDSAITASVKSAFLNDPVLKASQIEVITTKGVVTLNGTVNAETSVSRAIEVARAQRDVQSVQSNLVVKKDK